MDESRDLCLALPREDALVLFEFLSRSFERRNLTIEDVSEQYALWRLEGRLQELLAEPFRSDYLERLNDARGNLKNRMGPKAPAYADGPLEG